MNSKIILAGILLVGLLLRTLFIGSSPPSLYGDELTITLDAYSLLKTGHDQLGNFLPLTFPMGAGRPAGYVYFSIPFIAIFGPTALGVRFLSILSGIGIITLLYLIGRKLFSQRIGLIAALITAISPWEISLSRGGFEAHFALFLVLLGMYLFLKAKEKPIFYLFSAFSFGLALHTYPTYKITLPLFLLVLAWFTNIKKNLPSLSKKYFFSGVAVLVILAITSFSQTFIGGSETRFLSINVFSQDKLKSDIEEKINLERTITSLPKSLIKYFHNKPVEYVKILGENYLQNYSADFLFIHGDRNPRHNMATIGEFYFAEAILILIGFISLWQKQKRTLIFLMIWIILAPIPTAIIGDPHALRSAFMLPPLIFLSALGLITILEMKNKLPVTALTVVFVIQFAFFLQKLYFLAPIEYKNFWSFNAKQASYMALENRQKYDAIFLSDKIDNIEFAYPVYTKVEPSEVISQNKINTLIGMNRFKKYGNVYIGNIVESEIKNFTKQVGGKILIIKENTESNITTQEI